MRNFWAIELPVGDPIRGAPFGERTDPTTIGGVAKVVTPIADIAGMFMGAEGNRQAGSAARDVGAAQRASANYEAAQLDQAADQSIASASLSAAEQRRRATLVASRGLAVAAASGGGATDPTVVKLLADIEGEGAYRASVALYQGEERARQLRMNAEGKRYEGAIMEAGGVQRQRAYETKGTTSLLTGAASLFGKYGMGGPKKGAVIPDFDDVGTSYDE